MRGRFALRIAAILGLTVLLEIAFFDPHHVKYIWHVPGSDILIGFVGCVAIIVVSKWLGKRYLQRDEQYYEKGDERTYE